MTTPLRDWLSQIDAVPGTMIVATDDDGTPVDCVRHENGTWLIGIHVDEKAPPSVRKGMELAKWGDTSDAALDAWVDDYNCPHTDVYRLIEELERRGWVYHPGLTDDDFSANGHLL